MRQLHVVGVSDDGEELLLGPSEGKTSHRVPLDDRLRAAIRGQLSTGRGERAESALTPKEMQARMREGATPEEVAKAAGVPVARVLPYAAPVIAERERIVDQARAAVLHRHRGPNGQRPLGEVVDAHLADTAGFKPESVEWTARRRRDGAWEVLLSYAARGGRRAAAWLWRPLERDLTSLDVSATRLATEESGTGKRRASRTTATRAPAQKKSTAKKSTAKKKGAAKPAAKPAAKKKSAAKPAAKPAAKVATKPTPKKAASKKTAAKKATAKKATPKRTPAAKAAIKKVAARKEVARKVAVRKTTTRKTPTRAAAKQAPPRPVLVPEPQVAVAAMQEPPVATKPKPVTRKRAARKAAPVVGRPTVVPDPVLEAGEPPAIVVIRPQAESPSVKPAPAPAEAAPEETAPAQPKRKAGQRVPLPSWSDVLLGVAPAHRDNDNEHEPESAAR